MDCVTVIGLISSVVTIEEACRSWIAVIKEQVKKKGPNLNDWNSDNPKVQSYLNKFKIDMREKYQDHIFSEKEIAEIVQKFFENNTQVEYEDREEIEQFIREIIIAYNVYTKSLMSPGEKVLHNEMSSDFSKVMDKLEEIQVQPEKENIKKFLRAVGRSKDIELANIEEYINGEYEINRTEFIDSIKLGSNKIISIQGNAGSGKSVICKKLLIGKKYVLATRAENLALGKTLNEIWGCDVEDAILWLGKQRLYIFIDAIEFIADCGENAFVSLQEIYRLADKYENVFIITSCRSTDSTAFFKIDTRYRITIYETPELTTEEINNIAKKYPIIKSLQQHKKYSDLFRLPFYINLIISGGFVEENIKDENSFRLLIREKILCLKDKCAKYGITSSMVREAVENIVFTRAINFLVGVDKDIIDSKILEALISEGIIVENGNTIRLKYDIFEDICFERFIDKKFESCSGNYNIFFTEIEKIGRCIYRRYQIWVSNKLFIQSTREKFIYSLLIDTNIKENWKKETEIGIVKSKYCGLFFEESSELLSKDVIGELLNVTNLFAFEARIIHTPKLSMSIRPIGAARENLIKIASKELIVDERYKESLIKLCDDYSNFENRMIDVEKKACEIIIGYIDELIEKCKNGKAYLYSKELVKLFLIVSKMPKASKEWLCGFVHRMLEEYRSDLNRSDSVSEDILEAIIKNYNPRFVIELPELACEVAETLWTYRKFRRPFSYYEDDFNKVKAYGLSDKVDNYANNSVFDTPFIWYIMRYNFIKGFNWAIDFLNKSVDCFAKNNPEGIKKIEIFFADQNEKKLYFGNENLWLADTMERLVPAILGDIIYVIKRTIVNTITNTSDRTYAKKLAEYIRKTIYEKSNNILLLSVVETIGMNFEKELSGYAVELASSMELIYWDIRRYENYLHNPTKELLEKQILMSFGLSQINSRYEKDEKCAKSLQQYVIDSYLYGDEKIKSKCNVTVDYLYSIFDEKMCPNENLQIQKMDARNAIMTQVNENTLLLETQIQGEPQKIVQKNEEASKPIKKINKSLNNLVENVKNNEIKTDDIIQLIDELLERMQENDLLDMQYEATLIILIAGALTKTDIPKKQRNNLIGEWLKRFDKIFDKGNGSYIANMDVTGQLWMQLKEEIDPIHEEHILSIILNSFLNEEHSGLIEKISDSAVCFLRLNKKYAKRFFNTIVKLSEDEMNHQRFNAEYIEVHKDNEKFDFVPNMIPRLKGIDYHISKNGTELYENQKEMIIRNYLFKNFEADLSDFDIDNYDIGILCQLPHCGLDIEDEKMALVIKNIVICMIEIWNADVSKRQAHEIIDTFKEHSISTFFQYQLRLLGKNAEPLYDVLFSNIDFSKFTIDTIEFYKDIFGGFLSAYIYGFREKGKRSDIETKINMLEKYIEAIPEEWVRMELEKSLFLCVTRYNSWDVNKVKAQYSYKDKCFINNQLCKYGKIHLRDVLRTVYMLNIDELLPDILIGLSECFDTTISHGKEKFFKDVQDEQTVVDMIILKAFVNYSDEIKKDEKLINAYENILSSLTEIGNEKAAVLLDEFRIH